MPRKKLDAQSVTKPATTIKRGPGRPATKAAVKSAVKPAVKKLVAKKSAAKPIGKPVPKKTAKKAGGQLNFELPVAAHEAFKQYAADRGTSMTQILTKFVLKTVKMAA